MMKRIIIMAMLAVSLASCQKDPVPDADGEFLVYTEPKANIDFGKYTTYHVIDSVMVIEPGFKPRYSKTPAAISLVELTQENMTKRGYTQIADSKEADVTLALCYDVTSSCTLTITMTEALAPEQEKANELWEAMITGFLSYDPQYQIDRLKRGVDQAFEQSQYIKKK